MTNHLSEAVAEQIGHAESLYHRLVLVVGPDGSGRTSALRSVASRAAADRSQSMSAGARPILDPKPVGWIAPFCAGRLPGRTACRERT